MTILMRNLMLMIFTLWATSAFPNASIVHNPEVQAFIQDMVARDGFKRQDLINTMSQVKVQTDIIATMDRPYEKKPWDVYRALFLTPGRLDGGLAFWKKNAALLSRVERDYGVPASLIVSILGVETLYGTRQGNYRVLDALSTLAFYYPKRAPYFKRELREYLLLCREYHVSPTEFVGSYAGAIGKPQFMPSNYRLYAADYAHNTKKDLVHDDEAAIVSVANFIRAHGWQAHQDVAQAVKVAGPHVVERIHTDNKVAAYRVRDLKKAGVQTLEPVPHAYGHVGLIALDTKVGQEYWMTYPNFYVITRYNTSPQYAMVVYLFAQNLDKARSNALAHR